MKTVRLPIYDENGMVTKDTLEVDLAFFMPMNGGIASNNARVLPTPKCPDCLAETLSENKIKADPLLLIDVPSMHPTLTREELQMLSATTPTYFDGDMRVEIWKPIEKIPSKNFEINRDGVIRHKGTQRVIPAEWDVDHQKYRVLLTINGLEYSIYGPAMAQEMWEAAVRG